MKRLWAARDDWMAPLFLGLKLGAALGLATALVL